MLLKDDVGRGFYHNNSKNLFVWVNGVGNVLFNGEKVERESDQLRIMTIEKNFDIVKNFDNIAKMAEVID
jgi:hypothetical protein